MSEPSDEGDAQPVRPQSDRAVQSGSYRLPDSELRPDPDPQSDPRPDPWQQWQPAPQPDPGQHWQAAPQPEPRPQPQTRPQPEPQDEAEAQPQFAPQARADEPSQPPAPNAGWYVLLDDGREIPITRLTIFGRNPQPRPGEHDAQLIKVVDEARTVSKTHLALDVDSQGVFVTDRGSTNGSAVTDPYGGYNLIPAEQPVRLADDGYVVSFGSHHLRLVRH